MNDIHNKCTLINHQNLHSSEKVLYRVSVTEVCRHSLLLIYLSHRGFSRLRNVLTYNRTSRAFYVNAKRSFMTVVKSLKLPYHSDGPTSTNKRVWETILRIRSECSISLPIRHCLVTHDSSISISLLCNDVAAPASASGPSRLCVLVVSLEILSPSRREVTLR